MPTVLRKDGFRFYFYSNESNELKHIHVQKGDAEGKIWLEPSIEVEYMYGFTKGELKEIAIISFEYSELFKTKWDEYFSQ